MIFFNNHGPTFKSKTTVLFILIFILLAPFKVVGGSKRKVVVKAEMHLKPEDGNDYEFISMFKIRDLFGCMKLK